MRERADRLRVPRGVVSSLDRRPLLVLVLVLDRVLHNKTSLAMSLLRRLREAEVSSTRVCRVINFYVLYIFLVWNMEVACNVRKRALHWLGSFYSSSQIPPSKKKKKRHKKGEKSGYSIIQFSHMVLSPVNNCTTDAAVTSTTAMSKSFQQKPSRSGPPS